MERIDKKAIASLAKRSKGKVVSQCLGKSGREYPYLAGKKRLEQGGSMRKGKDVRYESMRTRKEQPVPLYGERWKSSREGYLREFHADRISPERTNQRSIKSAERRDPSTGRNA